jgi:ATP synthase protein I
VSQGDKPRSEEQQRVDASFEADEREKAALRSRLDRLSADLSASRETRPLAASENERTLSARSFGEAMSLGFRVLAEFVSAPIVGGVVGWQLDKWFGTSPAFIVALLLLGTAAGFWNVYRIAVKPQGRKP